MNEIATIAKISEADLQKILLKGSLEREKPTGEEKFASKRTSFAPLPPLAKKESISLSPARPQTSRTARLISTTEQKRILPPQGGKLPPLNSKPQEELPPIVEAEIKPRPPTARPSFADRQPFAAPQPPAKRPSTAARPSTTTAKTTNRASRVTTEEGGRHF